VTYERYQRFIEDGGYTRPELWTDQGWQWRVRSASTMPELWENQEFFGLNRPVVGVNWFEASAFARWAGGRLPTETEWELAAGWNSAQARRRLFPWGDSWNPDAANCRDARELAGRTTPVGIYPSGQSPHGIMDMVGNVWEWTSSAYMPYPYKPDDGRENGNVMVNRVLRGGTFWSSLDFLRCSTRFRNYPVYRFDVAGFRVAYDRT
jgi:iron(II)-dependent oxidoreductase